MLMSSRISARRDAPAAANARATRRTSSSAADGRGSMRLVSPRQKSYVVLSSVVKASWLRGYGVTRLRGDLELPVTGCQLPRGNWQLVTGNSAPRNLATA